VAPPFGQTKAQADCQSNVTRFSALASGPALRESTSPEDADEGVGCGPGGPPRIAASRKR
jgi:hypothetical protein